MSKVVGQSVPRNDGYDKVTGRGLFTHDISLPRMLHAKILRSPYAHAKVVSIDTSAAEAMPGVRAVCTFKNTVGTLFSCAAPMVISPAFLTPVLDQKIFTDEPRYIGDEIAGVAADTRAIAAAAIKAIKVEYEELPYVLDPAEAMKDGAPQVHPELDTDHNICGHPTEFSYGDGANFEDADYVVEANLKLSRVKQAQMETHAAVANYKGDGTLEVYSTTQAPHPTKMILARIFGMPESKVWVKNPPYVGGGFGVRIGVSGKAEVLAAALSIAAKRPVKCVYTREEDFIASDSRHGGYIRGKLGFKKDGTFVALDTEAKFNTGSYATFGVDVCGVAGACGTAGTYRIPNLHYIGYPIYTNQETAGAYRGYGTPQGTFLVETLVDAAAQKLGLDPIELRKKNTLHDGEKCWFPFNIGNVAVNECIDRAAEAIGWKEKRGKEKKGVIRHGVGIACGTHVSNAAPFCVDYNSGTLRLEQDGSMVFVSGVPEIGPGSTTALVQVASDLMGIPFNRITMSYGDTRNSSFDIGSHATRTLFTVSQILEKASAELKKEVFKCVADKYLPGAFTDTMTIEDGIVHTDFGDISLEELCYKEHLEGHQFISTVNLVPCNSLPYYAQAAEVEVDMETGMVKVLRVAAAHDVGKAVNPRLAEGQIEGAVLQGIGYACREEMTYEDGKGFYNEGFHKYMLPTADDHGEILPILVESNDPKGVYGIKGIGEVGICPTVPAIVSAVEDATGIRFDEIPMTPGRVLKRIQEVYPDGNF